ncbi:26.2 kDa [Spodoptera frugiperda ascovirus 1a]|uniref:26.2 kDa n=1 Tax=Spodoptera frugiperda ascovirus 1a TaxID=113370 RepID=Q0E565_SFAVA|nr:26.2 kDa [Spodoptera frugiperda ascovirus 1a]CAL44636.1 26.2 kDa [Spodoptera frugiperda ascovirus 1a]
MRPPPRFRHADGSRIGTEIVAPTDVESTIKGGSFSCYQCSEGVVHGYRDGGAPDRLLMLRQLATPPLMVRLSDDRTAINVYTLHEPTKPVAAVSLAAGDVINTDNIGVSCYKPSDYYPPVDKKRAMHIVYVDGTMLRLSSWSPKLQSWVVDHTATVYKTSAIYTLPASVTSQLPNDRRISRYYCKRDKTSSSSRLYAGIALCAIGGVLILLPSFLASRSAPYESLRGTRARPSVGSRIL